MLNSERDIISESTVKNDRKSIDTFFRKYKKATVAIEASTHSPWISRQLAALGCEVLVGNPRKLRVIWDSDDKTDKRDAKMLAQIARFDPKLLYPITHRGKQAQIDLEILQARDNLVKNRTNLINHVRGSVRSRHQPGVSAPQGHLLRGHIKKVWEVDPLKCSHCTGEMKIISFINEEPVIRKILEHLSLWVEEPKQQLSPVRAGPGSCSGTAATT